MFQSANFCLETRLLSNVINMILKDIIIIYRLYQNHIVEVLERFPSFTAAEAPLAFIMYENFVKLTEALKTKGNKLIYMFNFPLTLPELYEPDQE